MQLFMWQIVQIENLHQGLRQKRLSGIVLEKGGMSSLCVILARSMGIPCLIHTENTLREIKEGEPVLLDCVEGKVIISPDNTYIQQFKQYQAEKMSETEALKQFRNLDTVTKDGLSVHLMQAGISIFPI